MASAIPPASPGERLRWPCGCPATARRCWRVTWACAACLPGPATITRWVSRNAWGSSRAVGCCGSAWCTTILRTRLTAWWRRCPCWSPVPSLEVSYEQRHSDHDRRAVDQSEQLCGSAPKDHRVPLRLSIAHGWCAANRSAAERRLGCGAARRRTGQIHDAVTGSAAGCRRTAAEGHPDVAAYRDPTDLSVDHHPGERLAWAEPRAAPRSGPGREPRNDTRGRGHVAVREQAAVLADQGESALRPDGWGPCGGPLNFTFGGPFTIVSGDPYK